MAAPMFEFRDFVAVEEPRSFYETHGKRAFDILVLIFVAPAAIGLLAVMIAAVWLTGGQPLYAQKRIGRDGRIFQCWKIRTMVCDADATLPQILRSDPKLAEEWLQTQKLARDPRVTRIGAILRRTSLDELPQLWNVLRGHMSIVGPRPFMPEQQGLYRMGHRSARYYQLRPGITGLWQVSRRNRCSFAERVEYDDAYAERVSAREDLRILGRTVGVVLRATGV
ncbi:putative sugar transferase EpsL [Defluviimonas aquaemixtae]|uniref:Putative sugar transferase EpsL n=1 Tax=Albidovulum aquaemixtae TaxID=1542388 RepID=A0A2R8BJR4_9RHOB|nr:sugar transferase [Defluviimonas aquaemixtae]SPH23541.1 putative sugar transferase EpsL [Defluviimonas aquaemixtae]